LPVQEPEERSSEPSALVPPLPCANRAGGWWHTQVFLAIDDLEKNAVKAEAEFAGAEKLIAEAMGAIDAAKVKGALHTNTADRRKSKLARYKTRALTRLGLYTPVAAAV
jgi:hypothetical protein